MESGRRAFARNFINESSTDFMLYSGDFKWIQFEQFKFKKLTKNYFPKEISSSLRITLEIIWEQRWEKEIQNHKKRNCLFS